MTYQMTREKYGATTKYAGFVSREEFFQSVFDNLNDPDFDRTRYAVMDFLDGMGHGVTLNDVEVIGAYCLGAEFTNPNIKIAIVTTDQGIRDLVTGFTMLTHYPLDFFTLVADAKSWVTQDAKDMPA